MKLKYFLIFGLLISSVMRSQEKQRILFTIDDEPYFTSEFLHNYNRNKGITEGEENNIEDYLKLFVDFKLKIREAKELGIDTLQNYKRELNQYKENLMRPYLMDENVTNKLIKEAYDRMKKEVNVSHILLMLSPDASPKDTLVAYEKIMEARKKILQGEKFENVANIYSQDPSVSENGGNLGYFTALQMVYSFENQAYTISVNDISMPFKTKFGYHILKVNGQRNSRGEVEVAHIMLRNDHVNVGSKIDSLYQLIKRDKSQFSSLAKLHSEDGSTADNGGKLEKFGSGQMLEEFADVAFALEGEGDISGPFQTPFGWHIVQLIKKYPLESFDKMESVIRQKVQRSERSNLIGKSVVNKLKRQYKITIYKEALDQLKSGDWKINKERYGLKLLSIEDRDIFQNEFIGFLNRTKAKHLTTGFEKFQKEEVLNYYKDHLEEANPEFAAIFKEFKEGLLMFELLERKVWNRSKDSVGLSVYFNSVKDKKYPDKKLEDVKGLVVMDYQNHLQQIWMQQLKKKYKVTFRKSEKNKVFKLKK